MPDKLDKCYMCVADMITRGENTTGYVPIADLCRKHSKQRDWPGGDIDEDFAAAATKTGVSERKFYPR